MRAQRKIPLHAWADMFLLGLIWGGSFLAIRLSLDEVPVVTGVAHRVFWAALLLWGFVLVRRLPLPRRADWWPLIVMGLLNNVIPFSLMAWGQLYIPTGLTAVFNAGTAIFGVVIAALLLTDEKLTLRKALGAGIGFCGVVIAIEHDALRSFDLSSLAQLAVIGGTVSYAFAAVWARLKMGHLSPYVSAAGMLTGSSMVMVPAAFLIDGVPSLSLSPTASGAIAYYVVFATAVAYLLYYRILAAAGSGNTMIVTLLIPPVSIVLGAIVLDETLSANAYVGLSLLAVGLLILDGRLFYRGYNSVGRLSWRDKK